ncbi:MAG TPA: hypothetical protein VGJ21_24595 [Terracidiphilus sp.]
MKLRTRIIASGGLTLMLASASFAQQVTSGGDHGTGPALSSATTGKESWVRQAEDFVPMTNSERMAHYEYSLFGPQALLYSAAQAGLNQLRNTPEEWGQGAEGYGRRYGGAYAQHIIGATVANGIAFGLHEDNRYFKSGKSGIGRLSYAITSALLARHDDGSRFISFSAIGGTAAGAFISRTWQPPNTTSMGSGAVSFGIAMGARAGLNVVREFLPTRLERLLK